MTTRSKLKMLAITVALTAAQARADAPSPAEALSATTPAAAPAAAPAERPDTVTGADDRATGSGSGEVRGEDERPAGSTIEVSRDLNNTVDGRPGA